MLRNSKPSRIPFEDGVSKVGNGWVPLLRQVYDRVEQFNQINKPITAGIVVVGERHGGLDVRVDWFDPNLDHQIGQLIRESFTRCVLCGETATPRQGKIVRTLCDKHSNGKKPERDWV